VTICIYFNVGYETLEFKISMPPPPFKRLCRLGWCVIWYRCKFLFLKLFLLFYFVHTFISHAPHLKYVHWERFLNPRVYLLRLGVIRCWLGRSFSAPTAFKIFIR
jgi:hypothetical protein